MTVCDCYPAGGVQVVTRSASWEPWPYLSAAILVLKQDRRNRSSRDQLVHRIRGEFTEMPCLRVTPNQAQRLFGLQRDVCTRILEALREDAVLCRGNEGRYALNRNGRT